MSRVRGVLEGHGVGGYSSGLRSIERANNPGTGYRPLAGYREAPSFATDPRRLCVALSRHRAHGTIVVDTHTDTVLRHARAQAPNDTTLAFQQHVLTVLRAA